MQLQRLSGTIRQHCKYTGFASKPNPLVRHYLEKYPTAAFESDEFSLQIEAPKSGREVLQQRAGRTYHHDCLSSQYLYCLTGHQWNHRSCKCYEWRLPSARQAIIAEEQLYLATSVQASAVTASAVLEVAADSLTSRPAVAGRVADWQLVHSEHEKCHEDQSAQDTHRATTKSQLLARGLWWMKTMELLTAASWTHSNSCSLAIYIITTSTCTMPQCRHGRLH